MKIDDKLLKKGIDKSNLKKRDAILFGTSDIKLQNKDTCYELMVHKLCNEKCFFCSQDHNSRTIGPKPNDNDIYKRILFGKKQGYGMLGFTGGEPLIHPNIIKYIKFASKAGFNVIRVQTNGTMLGQPGFVEKCVDAGVTLFKFSIHHYKNEIHDYLVGLPGALEKVKYGIKKLKKIGCRMGINIVLTKQNYKDLPEILLYYLDMGITSYVIIFPLYENSMKDEVENVGFKFSDAIPYIVKSIKIFEKIGLQAPLILNLPMCLLPGYENAIIQTFNGTAVLNLDGTQNKIDDNKALGKRRVKICKNCKYNKICFGVDDEYLKVWGDGEFQEKKEGLDFNFSLDNLKLKEYFSDNELCLLEILKIKNNITLKEISQLKKNIQICKNCEDMVSILGVEKRLISRGYITVKGNGMSKIYSKVFFKNN